MPTSAQKLIDVQSKIARFGDPEREFQVAWAPATTLRSPASLRTDKVISFLILRWVGRITSVNAHATLPDSLRNLIQRVRVFGAHAVYGDQTPINIYGRTASDLNRLYRVGYTPGDNAAAIAFPNPTVMGATYDLEVVWTIPLFPLSIPLNQAALYSLKGPDWAGNLFVEMDTGDATALGGAAVDDTFSAFGGAGGTPTVFVSVVRPTITVDLMNSMSPAITFRTEKTLDNVAQGATFVDGTVATLNIGKKMAAVEIQTGTLFAPVTAGVRALATLIDTVLTRSFIALDGKGLYVPYSGTEGKEFNGWEGGFRMNAAVAGYKIHSFIRANGNAKSAFPAETLTAARRFELDGDVTGAATQSLSVVQEEILGSPAIG